MEFLGLPLGAVLGTLGGVGAVLVGLYLLKQRRRAVVVPHVALWEQLLSDRQASAWWKRLKQVWSLLLALLIAALVVFALGDPRRVLDEQGESVVILIDGSASMAATDVPGGRLGEARRLAREFIDQLGPTDLALVAQLDQTVTALTTLTDRRAELLAGVDRATTTALPADLRAGMAFARDVLRGRPGPRVVVVSDGQLEAAPESQDAPPLTFLRVGKGGANVAVTAFAVRRYPLDKSRSEVLISLRNFGDKPVAARLSLTADDTLLHEQPLTLPAGGELRRVLSDLPGADRTLVAQLAADDPQLDKLPADNTAYARLPARRRLKILTVSAGNRYLEAALLLDEYLQVDDVTPEAYQGADGYDVVIFDSWLPTSAPTSRALYLHPVPRPGGVSPLSSDGVLERPFVDRQDKKHPLLRYTALRDLNIGTALKLKAQPGDKVVAATQDRQPLIVAGSRNQRAFVALAFDPRQSDLPLRVAWPVLLLNALEHLSGVDGDYLSSFRAGQTWQVAVPDGADTATVTTPDGSERSVPVRDGKALLSDSQAGFYTLNANGARTVFAVNADADGEGDLKPAQQLAGQPPATLEWRERGIEPGRALWPWLVGIAAALLALEWFTYHRRWTV